MNFYKSKNPEKKYDAYDANTGEFLASFGGIRKATGIPYEQYHDSLGLYSEYDHGSSYRRRNYIKRHFNGLTSKREALKVTEPYTPNWFSLKFLW